MWCSSFGGLFVFFFPSFFGCKSCFCCGFFCCCVLPSSASGLGWPSLSDESTALSFLTFLTRLLFPSLLLFGLPCVFYTCAVEPLHVWALFFCLPLLPLSRRRAQGNRKRPKMTCELVLRLEIGDCFVVQKKKHKKWEHFCFIWSNLCILASGDWKTHLCFNGDLLPHTGASSNALVCCYRLWLCAFPVRGIFSAGLPAGLCLLPFQVKRQPITMSRGS